MHPPSNQKLKSEIITNEDVGLLGDTLGDPNRLAQTLAAPTPVYKAVVNLISTISGSVSFRPEL